MKSAPTKSEMRPKFCFAFLPGDSRLLSFSKLLGVLVLVLVGGQMNAGRRT